MSISYRERETKQEIIRLTGEPKARDKNDLYDLKGLTVNQLKDELRARSLPLTGLKPELFSRLTDALTVEHDLCDNNEGELEEVLDDENTYEDEFENYEAGVI